ncbi:hypothetical protein ACHAWF_007546, partial [Thalassiosira exigua]
PRVDPPRRSVDAPRSLCHHEVEGRLGGRSVSEVRGEEAGGGAEGGEGEAPLRREAAKLAPGEAGRGLQHPARKNCRPIRLGAVGGAAHLARD